MWESVKEWLAIGWEWILIIGGSLLLLFWVLAFFVDWYEWVNKENHKPTTAAVEIMAILVGVWNSFKVKMAWLKKSEDNLVNNIAKALLIGTISGVVIGLTGEDWNFKVYPFTTDWSMYKYGTSQAVIGGILVTLSLFLIYNKKK